MCPKQFLTLPELHASGKIHQQPPFTIYCVPASAALPAQSVITNISFKKGSVSAGGNYKFHFLIFQIHVIQLRLHSVSD